MCLYTKKHVVIVASATATATTTTTTATTTTTTTTTTTNNNNNNNNNNHDELQRTMAGPTRHIRLKEKIALRFGMPSSDCMDESCALKFTVGIDFATNAHATVIR